MLALATLAAPGRAQPPADLQPVDKGLATSHEGDKTLWFDIRELGVEGRGFSDTESFYDRLPARAKGVVRDGVWGLAHNSAGMSVRFVTDAASVAAEWTLRSGSLAMNHMPATGVSGLDLYARQDGTWHWVGVGRPEKAPTNQATLASGFTREPREFILYLPLYNGVESVRIGLPPEANLWRAQPHEGPRAKPVVFYGTSVTQGGCAARPGMAYPAIIGRHLDWPTINLGFSGNGQMEAEVAALMAEIDAAAYVLDCLPNISPQLVTERTAPVVKMLRDAHPGTPILLVENISYQAGAVLPGTRQAYESKNAALKVEYDRLTAAGATGLYYVPGGALLGDDGEATVDGTHPTDVGFLRIAAALEPVLRTALGL
jgi:lysophospholipase L1-like esterase